MHPFPHDADIIETAKQFAAEAHASIGQKRKYTNDDYIVHPTAVAEIVGTRPHTPEMIAAYLHDTVEDVPWVTLDVIRQRFGDTVAAHVSDLTNVSKPQHGNRSVRKAIDRAHTAVASNDAKTVKLADILHNAPSIIENDVNFAFIWCREKRLLLPLLVGGDPELYARVDALLTGFFETHGEKPIR